MKDDLLTRLLVWLKQQPEVENVERAGNSVVALLDHADLVISIEPSEEV